MDPGGLVWQPPKKIGWKCYREGKATQMAADGESLGAILTAGEWRSRAFLNCVHETAADALRFLEDTVDASDESEEDTETPEKKARR